MNDLIDGRFLLQHRIGSGSFGDIYHAKDTQTNGTVALKLETKVNGVLNLESGILEELARHPSAAPHLPRFVQTGTHKDRAYLAMGQVGENLTVIRRSLPDGRLSLYSTLLLGAGMLKALKAVHTAGFVHRDVKPGNFCLRFPLLTLVALGDASLLAPGTGRLQRSDRADLRETAASAARKALRNRSSKDKSGNHDTDALIEAAIHAGLEVRTALGLPCNNKASVKINTISQHTRDQLAAAGLDETDLSPGPASSPRLYSAAGAPATPARGMLARAPTPTHAYTVLAAETFAPVIIDFGLARRFADAGGQVRAPRPAPGFRGTARYASCAAHEGRELGPVDDLWSLLYIMIENLTGNLPWRRLRNRDAIGRCKQRYSTPETLCEGLPLIFSAICGYLGDLRYGDLPDYDQLAAALTNAAAEARLDSSDIGLPDWAPGPHASRALYEAQNGVYRRLADDLDDFNDRLPDDDEFNINDACDDPLAPAPGGLVVGTYAGSVPPPEGTPPAPSPAETRITYAGSAGPSPASASGPQWGASTEFYTASNLSGMPGFDRIF